MFLVVGFVGFWAALGCAPVAAQVRRPGQPDLPPLNLAGTIQEMGRGMIGVTSTSDQPWVLQLQPTSRIEVKGTAKADFLAPGQCVLFTATVDVRNARVEEKIRKLTIFTPDQRRPLGAFPDQGIGGGEGKPAAERPSEKPAEKPAFGAPSFGAPGATKGRKSRLGAKNAAAVTQAFEIHGQITGVKSGKLSLRVPNPYFSPALTVEVAEDAEIDVELCGPAVLALVRQGDKIQVRGTQVGQNAGRIGEAEITLNEPLGATQETPAKKKTTGKARAKKGEESDEPAPADETPQAPRKSAKKPAKSRLKPASDADESEAKEKE
ncbi:MAG: hypothetical protein NUV77_09315 [Thermoguttaceae bacterium]|nr:hypothetical protein [Thermoguttaceae bacterium]